MKTKKLIIQLLSLALVVNVASGFGSEAATVSERSVTLGSSAASASTTYLFGFKPGTTGNVGAIKFQVCTSPLEAVACVAPASATAAGASALTLGGQIAGTSGFVIGSGTPPAPTATTVWITDPTPESLTAGNGSTVRFSTITNPNTVNTQFYARITTYSDAAGTTPVDYGGIALSTAEQITVSGVMPESLVFCVGTSGTNCGNITGSAVDLGTFSPTATNTGTSVMSASTNAGLGYAITINGTTMSSGANTIAAMGTQTLNSAACAPSCTSTTGTSQFGSNVRANTVPAVGADVTGTGTATGLGGYNTVNSFRYFSGDTVASVGGVSQSNLFTNSYLVNVGGDQAAGVYTATMTYICTATF